MYLVPFYLVFEYEFKDISYSRMGPKYEDYTRVYLLIEGINHKAYAAQAAAPREDITVLYRSYIRITPYSLYSCIGHIM